MSQTDQLTVLPELLEQSGSSYTVYDCGRGLQVLTHAQFHAICSQQQPHPLPFQDHAWLAIEFWDANVRESEHFLWFLKLPLDERGLLSLAAQQTFVSNVITLLGQQITGALSAQQEQELQQSPYLFTPSETQRAALHARIAMLHQQSPSIHYERAQEHLRQPQQDGWQDIGLQGLHDVAARLQHDQTTAQAIATHFSDYSAALQKALAEALEQQSIPDDLAHALSTPFGSAEPKVLGAERINRLRALAGHARQPVADTVASTVLAQPTADTLVLLALRFWPVLIKNTKQSQTDTTNLLRYLEALAHCDQPQLFQALVSDLLRLPEIRPYLLMLLQRHDLPVAVQQAWEQFIAGVTRAG